MADMWGVMTAVWMVVMAVVMVGKMDGIMAGLWDHLSAEMLVESLAYQWVDLLVVKTTSKKV